jgi:hypothetical protein
MADEQPTTEFEPAVEAGAPPPPGGQSPLGVASEAFVGAAFAGGLALALILRRLTR